MPAVLFLSCAATVSAAIAVTVCLGVLNVQNRHTGVDVLAFLDGNQSLLRKQKQRARLVGVVGGNQNGRVGGNVRHTADTVAEQTERLIVNQRSRHQIGAVVLVVAVQEGRVLEVVGVQLLVSQRLVGQNVIVKFPDNQRVPSAASASLT